MGNSVYLSLPLNAKCHSRLLKGLPSSQPQEILCFTPVEQTLQINTEYYFKIQCCVTTSFVFVLAFWVFPSDDFPIFVSPPVKITPGLLSAAGFSSPQLEGKPSRTDNEALDISSIFRMTSATFFPDMISIEGRRQFPVFA